ncbi:MAG TPA: hypothetical protein VFS11_10275 [Gemmatimonadales bacterium]|nr:hypothetical protein [Gemmatimonadales bacterium]
MSTPQMNAAPARPLYSKIPGSQKLACALCPNQVLDHRHARHVHAGKHERAGRARFNTAATPPRWEVVTESEQR